MNKRNSSTDGKRVSYAICDANEQHELFGADRQVEESLAKRYRVEPAESGPDLTGKAKAKASSHSQSLAELPRPENVTVETLSWYPPILKLSWHLYELEPKDTRSLDFYSLAAAGDLATPAMAKSAISSPGNDDRLINEVDLDILLGSAQASGQANPERLAGSKGKLAQESTERRFGVAEQVIEELQKRRAILSQSLSCFQVTYNIINSR